MKFCVLNLVTKSTLKCNYFCVLRICSVCTKNRCTAVKESDAEQSIWTCIIIH